jgi:hypothetical protein
MHYDMFRLTSLPSRNTKIIQNALEVNLKIKFYANTCMSFDFYIKGKNDINTYHSYNFKALFII